MMQPIRWNNVETPGLGAPAQTLESAARLLSGAFSSFQKPMDQANATEEANWQQGKTNNLADLRMKVMSIYKNADELKAAQESGALDALYKSYAGQIDKGAAADFMDQRGDVLRQRGINDVKYQGAMRDEKAAPFVDQLRNAILNNDKEEEAKARASLTSVGYRNFADQNLFADQRHRELTLRTQQDRASEDSHLMTGAQIKNYADEQKYRMASLGIQRDQFGLAQKQFGLTVDDRMREREAKLGQTAFEAGAEVPTSLAGQQAISASVKDIGDETDRANRLQAMQEIVRSHPDMATSSVIRIGQGMGATKAWLPNVFARWGAYSTANSIAGSEEDIQARKGAEARQGKAITDLKDVQQQREDFGKNPVYGLLPPAVIEKLTKNPTGAMSTEAANRAISNAAAKAAASQEGPDPLDTPDFAGNSMGRVPEPPQEKVWQGNQQVTNPAYKAWEERYGNAYQKQVAERNRSFAARIAGSRAY